MNFCVHRYLLITVIIVTDSAFNFRMENDVGLHIQQHSVSRFGKAICENEFDLF